MHPGVYLLLVLVVCPVYGQQQCNKDASLQHGIVEAMLVTDLIVHGEYKGVQAITGYGQVQIYCIFKANGVDMPENITIQFETSSCPATVMQNNTQYIIMLRTLELLNKESFQLKEPSPESSAAYPATEQNLKLAVDLCGLNNIRTPTEKTQTMYGCPKRTATGEDDCVKQDVASRAAITTCTTQGKSVLTGLLVMLGTAVVLGNY